jgi:hypothetical protein
MGAPSQLTKLIAHT